MGVVDQPIPHRQFNGKIFMEGVSRTHYVTTATAHTNFSDDALVNGAIKSGDWKQLVDLFTEPVEDLVVTVSGVYNLEYTIVDRIDFLTLLNLMGMEIQTSYIRG